MASTLENEANSSKNVFILSGQSNMAGRGGVEKHHWDGVVPNECSPDASRIFRLSTHLHWEVAREPLHHDIDSKKTCGVGPGMSFANAIKDRVEAIGLVPCAVGGTAIKEWAHGEHLYVNMVKRARAAMHHGGEIKALLWYQGESDTLSQHCADTYKANMEKLIHNVRADLHLPSLPIIQEQRAAIAEQGIAIARLQNGGDEATPGKTKGVVEIGRNEPRMVESNGSGASSFIEVLKMLETLAKRVDSTEKRVETYNSRVDQIPGAPPLLKGPNSKRYIQRPFRPSAAPKLIPKRFKMPDIQKYDGTTGPCEHVTSYTCAIKGNDMEDDEIESVLLKKFGETLAKGALTWYDHLPEHSITSFETLADAFIKAHAGAKKVQARKADIFRIAQRNDELLREFVSRFQRERMELPPVPEEWAAQAFTKGLNVRSSTTSFKLKESLVEYEAVTWADVHNRYESKIRVEDDQLELPPGPVIMNKSLERPRKNYEPEARSSRERYRPYSHPEKPSFRTD
ncbi:uncharacterized protein LOC132603136 isoform X1 [Lycium barbarum]|uniref:uncharacterized protein LOC132603136 isoform X1 n=1 Tax=Lycium barbarum TaxID=112863 RepID=UPI00293E7B57|nr:uncharacterized protein LOC132603136 isoform X1 [Lycium barbarum]